jgi:hypothetical protein
VPCSLVEIDRRFRGVCCHHHIALTTEAVTTSENSVNFYETTGRNIPEDGHRVKDCDKLMFVNVVSAIKNKLRHPECDVEILIYE